MPIEIDNNLPQKINQAYDRANSHALKARENAAFAIAEAQHCGQLLTQAKLKCGYGEWDKWLTENCPNVPHTTAWRFMRLAASSKVISFNDCRSLTQAYIAVGALPEPPPNAQPEPSMPIPYLSHLQAMYQAGARAWDKLKGVDVDTMPDHARASLKSQLMPVRERLAALDGLLARL